MVEIEGVNEKLGGMRDKLLHLQGVLPVMEHSAENFASVSQETLASAEQMIAASEDQVTQIESNHHLSLKLSGLSTSLSAITKDFILKS